MENGVDEEGDDDNLPINQIFNSDNFTSSAVEVFSRFYVIICQIAVL